MERRLNRAYCGSNIIINALGSNTTEVAEGVMAYQTHIQPFTDGTPVCMINKAQLQLGAFQAYTFAEQLSILAISAILEESGIALSNPETLLILSTTKGNVGQINKDFQKSYLWEMSNSISNHFHCSHTPLIVSNACISGVAAIINGARLIEEGLYKHVIVVGVDVVNEFIVSGFNSFKSISPTICRPYNNGRDGLTLGEGCGALLLTSDQRLASAAIVVSGGAISDDANHISGPSRTGDGLFFAINNAMQEAGITAEEVGLFNAHGTGTPFNDEMESKALNLADLSQTPCNSLKPYFGHTLGASGVIETILTLYQLQNNIIFGVKGFEELGTPLPLNISSLHRNVEAAYAMKIASAFGGTNAALVLTNEPVLQLKKSVSYQEDIVHKAHSHI